MDNSALSAVICLYGKEKTMELSRSKYWVSAVVCAGCLAYFPLAYTSACDAKTCQYSLNFTQPGFYVAQVQLPSSEKEGFWGLEINTSSGSNSGGFNAGAVLQENGTTPGFIGFYLGAEETVTLTPYEYTGMNRLNVAIERQIDTNTRSAVFGPSVLAVGEKQTTASLAPGFYIASAYSKLGDARGRFGLELNGNQFTGGVNIGGWIDSATGGNGEGFGAFYVASSQTVKLNLYFGDSYGTTGAGQPNLAIFSQDSQGNRTQAWNSAQGSLNAQVTGDGNAPSTTSSANSNEPADFSGTVAAHNAWRSQVKVADLQWSDSLAEYAQNWANNLKFRGCEMAHNPNNQNYGENIYWSMEMSSTPKQVPKQVVDAWGSEIADYDYASNTCVSGKQCGHYTQVVWANTTHVGCGKATCVSQLLNITLNNYYSVRSETVWVCNYNPPGNYNGEKPY